MLKTFCWCAIWCFTSIQAAAQERDHWLVIPSTCIVDKSGDICRLELNVQPPKQLLNQTKVGEVCFSLQQQRLSCVSTITAAMQVDVVFEHPSLFEVFIAEQMVHNQQLDIQTLAPSNQRRRVRSPWSLF
ncbi:MAG: DUF3019 domain-containing protein [Aestuariibacter sp.]